MPDQRDPYERVESEAHRLDRNYGELLQELRVAQMGVQILFAFLLSIAFQQRFSTISSFGRDTYLVTLACATVSAALFIAPVAIHRAVFREHVKDELVRLTSRLAVVGLAFLALAMLGALLLIVDFVQGRAAAAGVAAAAAVVFGCFWVALPLYLRRYWRLHWRKRERTEAIR